MWPLTGQEIYSMITKQNNAPASFANHIFQGTSTDSRKIQENEIFIAIQGEKSDGHDYLKDVLAKGIKLILVQKNKPQIKTLTAQEQTHLLIVDDVLTAFRQLAKRMRSTFPFPVIGVGGSNGKTTTKEMLFAMLQGSQNKVTKTEKSENGFLGMAITLTQKNHTKTHPPFALVLEIGIDTVGAMTQHLALGSPNIALLTALGPEHLSGLKNWDTAAKEELILFSDKNTKRCWQLADAKTRDAFYQTLQEAPDTLEHDCVVIESTQYDEYLQHKKKHPVSLHELVWSVEKETPTATEVCLYSPHIKLRETQTVPLPGKHNAANFALAWAAALLTDLTFAQIKSGFAHFVAPPMRSAVRIMPNQAVLYDDTYNASPMSIEAALESLKAPQWQHRKKIVVLGDMLDLGEESKFWHEDLFRSLSQVQNAHLCLYGSSMYDCYKLLHEKEDTLLKQNQARLFWLNTSEDPSLFLSYIEPSLPHAVILVKGSRGMRLERLTKVIEDACQVL